MLQFQNIEFLSGLFILLPLIFLLVYVIKWKQKVKQQLGDVRLVEKLMNYYSPDKYKTKIIIAFIALTLSIIAAANLRKPAQGKGSMANGIDVMIALDVSKSMLSQDEKPSRLEKAKLLINKLTNKLENNRIGLIVFAGQAYLQMPLTADAAATKMFVSGASPELVSVQGTNISDALRLCDVSLDTKEKKYKAAILITDGEDQDDRALETVKELADHGTIIHTVGVGSADGSPIIEPGTNEYKKDENGQTVISKLNEQLLKDLAQAGNGTYHSLNNLSIVSDALVNELNGMEKKSISNAGGFIEYQSYYVYFLLAAILLLVAEFFISEKKLSIA